MSILRYCACLLVLGFVAVSSAAFADSQYDYDQCLMQSLKGSQNGNATALITDACNRLYRNGSLLAPRDRGYYRCILQYIPGVESGSAVQQIASACRRQNGWW